MPAERRESDGATLDESRIMLGVLALLAADRDERVEELPSRRSELVLADAGFTAQEIAKLTGRNYEAVRSSLRRRAQPTTSNAKDRAK
jgi:DNA-directed RNA polymerase specialized sigma24 family protein